MTKREMVKRYEELLAEKKVGFIDGISANSSKHDLANAISCLECSDESLDKCADYVKGAYPAMHRAIMANGNFKLHSYNRLFVFNTAKLSA